MRVSVINSSRRPDGAMRAAERLQRALADHGVRADVHAGDGVALVSVWVDLVVWTDGGRYWWWSGRLAAKTGRRVYAFSPATNPVTTAARVAARRKQLLEDPRRPGFLRELASETSK